MEKIDPARIRAVRCKHNLTQKEAAADLGVTVTTWARWERSERDPTRGPRLVYNALLAWITEKERQPGKGPDWH
jgi:DNA-binding transcriptional regulator YiaG